MRGSCSFALLLLLACGDEVTRASETTSTGASASASTGAAMSTGPAASTGSGEGTTSTSTSTLEAGDGTLGTTEVGGEGSSSRGTGGSTGTPSSTGGLEPEVPVVVAVGYGGMRVRSLDEGQTWTDYRQLADAGGDDRDLLRGAAWGEGRFVAVGWRIFSSLDGATWTERENPIGQWLGAVQHGNGIFLAVGGGGRCARSDDGETWEACTDATDDAGFTHVRSVLFTDGRFWAASDDGQLRSSPEGDAWTLEDAGFGSAWAGLEADTVVVLDTNAPAELPGYRLIGGSEIQRAAAGTDAFVPVFDVPQGNRVFQGYRFAFARSSPGDTSLE